MVQFKPIGKISVSTAIIEQITDLITSGELKPGDRLPSERQLSEQFKVGRSSVREAMITLQSMGIIERRNKVTILSNNEEKLDLGFLKEIGKSLMNIKDVLEARNLLESEIVLLAVERATPEDIAQIALQNQKTDEFMMYAKIDRKFHVAIAEAVHNPVLSNVYNLMLDSIFSTHNIYEVLEKDNPEYIKRIMQEGWESHQKIFMAIASGDRKMAKEALAQHLHSAEAKLLSSVMGRESN